MSKASEKPVSHQPTKTGTLSKEVAALSREIKHETRQVQQYDQRVGFGGGYTRKG